MFFKLYTKPGCHLCNEVRDVLEESGVEWNEINILEYPDLEARYRYEIPVVESSKGCWFFRERDEVPLKEWLRIRS